jgi:predicted ribosome quality control (RQC) complex YloA/Tae2 family protein
MFYEDIYDALRKTVDTNPRGLKIKTIACEIWPAKHPDTARSELSRSLNPEDRNANLRPEEIVRLMEVCGPEHVLYYLCDRFIYERTMKKNKAGFEREMKSELKQLLDGVMHLGRKIEDLERIKEIQSRESERDEDV